MSWLAGAVLQELNRKYIFLRKNDQQNLFLYWAQFSKTPQILPPSLLIPATPTPLYISFAEKHWNMRVLFLMNPPRQQKQSINWLHSGTKGVNNLEMSSVSTINHGERMLPQCFSANDVIIKGSRSAELGRVTRINMSICSTLQGWVWKGGAGERFVVWGGGEDTLQSMRISYSKARPLMIALLTRFTLLKYVTIIRKLRPHLTCRVRGRAFTYPDFGVRVQVGLPVFLYFYIFFFHIW